jgi:hypothetical protein
MLLPMATPRSETTPLLSPADARRLFLAAQGLLDDPGRRCDTGTVLRLVDKLGFVQIDSIRVVERAQHLILAARLDGYRPSHLRRLLERDRRLFEHWTHDAAAIPTRFFPHWQHRFAAHRVKIERNAWWRARLGPDAAAACAAARERIRNEGPLQSRDFESPPRGRDAAWWGWKPQKAALEYLWHTGELAITRRESFQKVYDLTERVLPAAAALPAPSPSEHLDWACRTALERLGVATASEIAAFWRAVEAPVVREWCASQARAGSLVAVCIASADGSRPVEAWAPADWRGRLRRASELRPDLRLLAPFDPIVRDRRRTLRLFGFDYRFEGFVPAPRRRFGYYVLPILEGDRFVGRLDPKPVGADGRLRTHRVWWEPGVRATRARRRALEVALERLLACRDAAS